MPNPPHQRVLLITRDAALREAVASAAPRTGVLRCAESVGEGALDWGTASECWIDLDTAPVPPAGPFARYVYFARRGAELPRVFPTGLLVANPATRTAISVLWAEAMREDRDAPWRLLPIWVATYQTLDLPRLQTLLVEHLPRQLGYNRAALYLRPAIGESWLLAASSPLSEVESMNDERDTIRRLDAMVDEPSDAIGGEDSFATFLPLATAGEIVAVLKCSEPLAGACREPGRIAPLLEFCARCLQHALRFSRADRDARFDALTGLYNRRGIEERLQIELRRAARYHTALSILMVDLDGLKQINDRDGHPAGDEAIRHAAARMQAMLRESDCAGRLGGDEFLVVLPATNAEGARLAAERILNQLRQKQDASGKPLIGASIGGAEAARGAAVSELIAIADDALYGAKRDGRGCVRVVSTAGGDGATANADLAFAPGKMSK
ncbi:MAG: GGDEF domain-containing protein [Phycisphaerae bacterium]|nr:GGDEF domain-containing protein [Phycisphaerae bacterium]